MFEVGCTLSLPVYSKTNIPALAREEIVPVAVSEASTLTPEELFTSEGPFKHEGELTRDDRKRL